MEALLILLVIPAIAFMMLRADQLRINGLDPETRDLYRKLLALIAVAFWGVGGIFLVWGGNDFQSATESFGRFFVTLARVGLGFGLIYVGWKAWQVSRHVEQEDLPLQEIVCRDLQATSARTAAILFIFLPLALPSLVLMSTVGFVPVLIYAFSASPRRQIQNQLLWTLALATKNRMDLGSEVNYLAESLRKERNTGKALALNIIKVLVCLVIPLFLVFFVPLYFRVRARRKMYDQMMHLASSLYDGVPLSEALTLQPKLLPPEVIGAIEAAEESGHVADVLSRIAMEYSRQLESRATVGRNSETSAAYAAMIVVVTVNVVAFIMYFIIPKFKHIFQDFGVELPRLTETWIAIADVFAEYWYLMGPMMFVPLVPFLVGSMLMLDDSVWLPSFILRMFPRIEAPMLLKRLGYVAANAEQLQPSLLSLANSTPDFARSRRYERVEDRISRGDSLGTSLLDEGFINQREAKSIDFASQIGHLGWALISIANSIQNRRINRSRWAMEFLRPAVFLILAGVVASFCIALFLPLIKLLNELS